MVSLPGFVFALFIVVFFFLKWINILKEYERAVVFRLGRIRTSKGPGLVLIFWPIETMVRVSLRTIVHDVPSQDIITRDNVSVKVNAVVYFRVVEPNKAVVQVENYLYATSQLAQTTLRSILGQANLDELLSEREKLNVELQ
ncbi:MAG TPA: SPFH domain-containing protein, partial [Thermoanaerobaculia bacterium]|nr:SPFH domain-containing protein [Thermoanaerobaculia bacterium]